MLGVESLNHEVRVLSGVVVAVVFFFQAEDGIRYLTVTGVQTCALPILIMEDGEVQHVAVLPIGGQLITHDLAIGLKTDLDIAELVKVSHATLAQQGIKRDIRIKAHGQDYVFKAEEVAMITEARVEELFEYVDKELSKVHRSRKLPGGAVLVGGTAKLPGIAEFAKEKLQLAVRVGKLGKFSGLVDTVADPSFCTAVGLMMLDMLLLPESEQGHGGRHGGRALNFADALFRRFKR